MSTDTKLLIAAIVGMVLFAAVLIGLIVFGIRSNESDRRVRTARVNACRSIENEAMRTLCLVKP